MFIDTHTHVTDEAFRGEEDAVVERAVAAGVGKMLLADTGSAERPPMFEFCGRHPGVVFPMLGVHPENLRENWRDEVDLLEAWLPRHPVAIGEIGLDYHWDVSFKEQQKAALMAQFELAASLDLPVNIHLRDATEDFVDLMKGCAGLHLRGNLHAYSGSYETWKELCRYGDWSIGVGGVVTFKNARLPEVVAAIPLEKILLETDAPYLAPTPLRGTRNESANIPIIAAKVAETKGVPLEEVEAVTTHNALELFAL
ncbi:MAG: TatD family hydrolase [Bacteroidales bacterium]|nr:TatD family hydrolase [Bacteroidales bacterium]